MLDAQLSMTSGVDARVCDSVLGVVRSCFELPLAPDDPRLHCFISEATHAHRFAPDAPGCPRFGCGVDTSRAGARGAAMGEVLERYSASLCAPPIRRASHRQLEAEGLDAVAPERFALFSEHQYETFYQLNRSRTKELSGKDRSQPAAWPLPEPFTADRSIGWIEGISLHRRRPTWVPGPMVAFPYRYEAGESWLLDPTSTGLACATSGTEALLKALYEVVERDALSTLWYARLALPQIPLEGELAQLYHERIAAPGLTCYLLDATLDIGIPTVVAVLLDERGGSILGSSTRLDPQEAARKALLEAAQGRIVWRRQLAQGSSDRQFSDSFFDVVDFSDHPRAFLNPSLQPRLDFLKTSARRHHLAELPGGATGDPDRDLHTALERVNRAGFEAIAFDLTSSDLEPLGYRVVRMVIPGLLPLNARHLTPPFGSRRLRELPHQLGFAPAALQEAELHRLPHPFA